MLSSLGHGLNSRVQKNIYALPTLLLEGSLPPGFTHTRPSVAQYQDAEGNWHQAAVNEARFGYLYGFGPGLIIEESVTNRTNRPRAGLGSVNQAFLGGTTATTQGRNATSIVSDIDAPTQNLSNGSSIWRVNNVSGNAVDLASVGGTDSTQPSSAMIHYKHVSGDPASVYLDNYAGTRTLIGSLNSHSGWQISAFDNFTPDSTGQVLVIEVPNNTEIDICYINLQTSPYITSPIDQFGGSDTSRSADLVKDSSASWYHHQEGTFVIEYFDRTPRAASTFQSLFYIGDGGNNNRIAVIKNSQDGDLLQRTAASGTNSLSTDVNSGILTSGLQKLAIGYKDSDHAMALNGLVMKTSQGSAAPQSITGGFSLGSQPNGSLTTNIIVKSLGYYDQRLSNYDLSALTLNSVSAQTSIHDLSIVLFGGQSGSSGAASGSTSYSNAIQMIGNDGILKPYSDPYDANQDQLFYPLSDPNAAFSYAGTVVDGLASNLSGNWAATPANRWNTQIDQDWSLNTSNGLDERVYALIRMGSIAKSYGSLRTIVWDLGVTDAIVGTPKASFKSATQDFLLFIRQNLAHVPIILVSLHEWSAATTASETSWNDIRDAQIEIATELDFVYLADISDLAGKTGDEAHLDTNEVITAGQRISNTIRSALI